MIKQQVLQYKYACLYLQFCQQRLARDLKVLSTGFGFNYISFIKLVLNKIKSVFCRCKDCLLSTNHSLTLLYHEFPVLLLYFYQIVSVGESLKMALLSVYYQHTYKTKIVPIQNNCFLFTKKDLNDLSFQLHISLLQPCQV